MHIKTQIAGKIMNEINDYLEKKIVLITFLTYLKKALKKSAYL